MKTEQISSRWGLILYLLPSGLGMAWLVSKAQWFWTHRPDLQFGWVVLLLCAFLVWDQWDRRPPLLLRLHWINVASGLFAFGMLFVFQIYHAAFGLMPAALLGLVAGVYLLAAANVHYVFGEAGLRHFGFALGFLLIAFPMPSAIQGPVVSLLQSWVAGINVELLKLLGIPAYQVGNLIHLSAGTVGIDEACSGIRSLQSTIMATLFIGYLTLKHRSLQVTLFILGLILAVTGNVLRSLFLSLMANARGIDSLKEVHDAAGWSVLAFTVVGVGLAAWGLNRLEETLEQMEK